MARQTLFPSGSVAEAAAPFHSGPTNSIRSIQRGAADLLRQLMRFGGLSPQAAAHLRAGDVDLDRLTVRVRDFEGNTVGRFALDRTTANALRVHLAGVRLNHERDRIQGLAGVWVPPAIRAADPAAGESWEWYWLFPARHVVPDPRSGRPWRPSGEV
jgi:integrase